MLRRRFPARPVAQPIVTSIAPPTAAPAGGSSHTVAGSFLETTNTVWVGGVQAAFAFGSGALTFTAPALSSNTYPVEVITTGGSARIFPGLVVTSAADALLTEAGDTLTTEAGDRLVLES